MIEYKNIPQKDIKKALSIAKEYLNEKPREFLSWYEKYPELFVGCYKDDELIGICFGYPFSEEKPKEKDKILLKGIAIKKQYSKKKYGSNLIAFFEEVVGNRKEKIITLGSAEEYVEKFYIKNSYEPVEYLITVSKDKTLKETNNKKYKISKKIITDKGIKLYIKTRKYEPKKKEELKSMFGADEVIYIFEKKIK